LRTRRSSRSRMPPWTMSSSGAYAQRTSAMSPLRPRPACFCSAFRRARRGSANSRSDRRPSGRVFVREPASQTAGCGCLDSG
jgi:hypothetical protein